MKGRVGGRIIGIRNNMNKDEKYVATRQVLLELLETVSFDNGLANEPIGKLHIDAATDKIEGIWSGV
jgi:hypothetical protein